jgi:hypothetical protein
VAQLHAPLEIGFRGWLYLDSLCLRCQCFSSSPTILPPPSVDSDRPQIHFLETVDATALTISPLEYEVCIAQSKERRKEKEREWGRRAEELSTREMIWREDDGQITISGTPPPPTRPLTFITAQSLTISKASRHLKQRLRGKKTRAQS